MIKRLLIFSIIFDILAAFFCTQNTPINGFKATKWLSKEQKKAQREISRNLILYINMANFPKAVEGCWGRGLLDDVKWKN